MKTILVCDDDTRFIKEIEDVIKGHSTQIRLFTVTELSGLMGMAKALPYDTIYLDGFLKEGTTLPFLKALRDGQYSNLKDTHFVLISSDSRMRIEQISLLSEEREVTEENVSRFLAEISQKKRDFYAENPNYLIGTSHSVDLWKVSTTPKECVVDHILQSTKN